MKHTIHNKAKHFLQLPLMLLLIFTLLFGSVPLMAEGEEQTTEAPVATSPGYAEPVLTAVSAILVDAETGQILYEKNADEQRTPASITKLITGLVIVDQAEMDDVVTVTNNVLAMEHQTLKMEPHEQFAVEDLFYAMLIGSSNDASELLAEAIGGTTDNFVVMMNNKLKELGCTQTQYMNPHGLTEEGHYTTARDLVTICRAALDCPEIMDAVGLTSYKIYRETGDTNVKTTNNLLKTYDGMTGLKTGYTKEAGYCMAASAERDGRSLIGIVLGCKSTSDRFAEAEALLDYGFEAFEMFTVEYTGREVATIDVEKGDDLKLYTNGAYEMLRNKGVAANSITSQVILKEDVVAPVATGTVLGTIHYYDGSELICSVPLINTAPSERYLISYTWFQILIGIGVLVALFLIFQVFRLIRRSKKNGPKAPKAPKGPGRPSGPASKTPVSRTGAPAAPKARSKVRYYDNWGDTPAPAPRKNTGKRKMYDNFQ